MRCMARGQSRAFREDGAGGVVGLGDPQELRLQVNARGRGLVAWVRLGSGGWSQMNK